MNETTTFAEDVRHARSVVRRNLALIAATTVIAVAVGALVTARQEPGYLATSKLVVGQRGSLFDPSVDSGSVVDSFTQTLADLVESEVVAARTLDDAGVDMSTKELRERLEVSLKPSTTTLSLSFVGRSRREATRVLDSVAASFGDLVAERFTVQGEDSPLTVTVFDPAHVEEQVAPRPVRNLALAAVVGAIVGLFAAFLRDPAPGRGRQPVLAEQAVPATDVRAPAAPAAPTAPTHPAPPSVQAAGVVAEPPMPSPASASPAPPAADDTLDDRRVISLVDEETAPIGAMTSPQVVGAAATTANGNGRPTTPVETDAGATAAAQIPMGPPPVARPQYPAPPTSAPGEERPPQPPTWP